MLWNRILLIYDGSEGALRATEYVAKMFGQTEGVQVTIYGLHEKIPRHDLKDTSPVVEKLQTKLSAMEIEIERGQRRILESKKLLAKAGMDESAIQVKYLERKQSAIKEIATEADQGEYGTLVVGRNEHSQGVLAGGNVVKDLVNQIKDRAVLVV